ARAHPAGAADRNGLRVLQIVGLVGADAADQVRRIARLQLRLGVRYQRRGPILVCDAEPAVGDLPADGLFLVDLLVGELLQTLLTEIADQALVQDVVAGDLRRAVPRDQREWIECDRRAADIADLVLDREEIAIVD